MNPTTRQQPPLYKVTLQGLLRLPGRLCKPPMAVGKVRSCEVVPALQISLEDILNRHHLPPLTLKEFEDYLYFVERSPENLYYTLWFRDFARRYEVWQREGSSDLPLELASSFTRAKATFLSPMSPLELNLPSDFRDALYASNVYPHPDLFQDINSEVDSMLQLSMSRFVYWSLSNTGRLRALCGIVGGACCVLASLIPVLLDITRDFSRWIRLIALPFLLIGSICIVSSLNGVCPIIYLLGDARQLRPFELARPPISEPQRPRKMKSDRGNTDLEMARTISGSSADCQTRCRSGDNDNNNVGLPTSPTTTTVYHPKIPFQNTADSINSGTTYHPKIPSQNTADSINSGTANNASATGFSDMRGGGGVDDHPSTTRNMKKVDESEIDDIGSDIPGQPFARVSPRSSSSTDITLPFDFDALPVISRNVHHIPIEDRESSRHASTAVNVNVNVAITSPSSFPSPFPFQDSDSPNVPIFAPMTTIDSPIVQRAHWQIMIRSTLIGIIFSAAVMVSYMMIPPSGVAG